MNIYLSRVLAALMAGNAALMGGMGGAHLSNLDAPSPPSSRPIILILFSEDSSQPSTQLLESGLTESTSGIGVADAPVLFFEYLDATRYEDQPYRYAFARFLRDKYSNQEIHLILPISQSAIQFTADVLHEQWPGVPILFGSTHSTTVDPAKTLPYASGMIFEFTFADALTTIRSVLPDTRHVALIWGMSTLERERTARDPDTVRSAGLDPIVLAGLSLSELVSNVSHLPDHTVVHIAGPLLDASGQMNPAFAVCELITRSANAPAFMTGGQFLGCGVLGGKMRDFRAMGRLLGERALTVRPGIHPTVESISPERFTTVAFDARVLERWRVPESRLPTGSVVVFRTPSLWRDYRGQVLAALGAVVFQMLLIVGLLYERHHRLKAESEARRSLALTARIDRLSAMTELSGSIAHELSQPLSSILHNASAAEMLLASNRGHPDQLREILADIRSEDVRANQIVQRHRAMFKHREMESRHVDLNKVVQECLAIIGHDAVRRDVRMHVELSERSEAVLGDQVLLQQVVLNLLLNAMDAMASTPAERRRLIVRTMLADGAMEVSVSDSGAGVSPDVIHRLFEPFVTTKADGMGIGLAISRSIVEAHGGSINLRNNPGDGATFFFTVPCART